MSWEIVRRVFEQSKSKPMARLVLLNLAERATVEGMTAWPSRETIARECGLSVRGVHGLLRYLRGLGEIDFTSNNKGGNGRSNRYKITLPNPAQEGSRPKKATLNTRVLNPAPHSPEPEEPEVPPLENSPPSKSLRDGLAPPVDSGW